MSEPRERLEVDVLFVGAGPACLSGALHLANLIQAHNRKSLPGKGLESVSIALIEKGREVGAHTLSGAILDPIALAELIPDYRERNAPLGTAVSGDSIYYLTEGNRFRLPWVPPPLNNHGNSLISLSRFVRWLGELVEARGVDLFAGFAGTELLFEGERLVGVRTGDKGIDRENRPRSSWEPGVDVLAKVVVLGEGVHGSLAGQAVKRLGLDRGKAPQVYARGVKEGWELPEESPGTGEVIHTLGYPLRQEEFGGGFLYHMGRTLSLGLVVGLDYKDPFLDPHRQFQRFKSHPLIASRLAGARLAAYGAKALPEGGHYAMPRSYFDGGLLIGDSAGLVNSMRLKGIHLAMKSGMLAAETVLEALLKDDFSEGTLSRYPRLLARSWAGRELYRVRYFHQGFERGLVWGLLQAGLQMATGGRGWKDPLPSRPGHRRMRPIAAYHGAGAVPSSPLQANGKTTFDKLTNDYYSGTRHEEDQPSHLRISDPRICQERCPQEFGSPCQHFCPANVYEVVPREDGKGRRLQINPSNCVHCKTCDIMDPYQVITWVPPEGGGGPNYVNL